MISTGRQSGRTQRMLEAAANFAYHNPERISIIAHTHDYARHLRDRMEHDFHMNTWMNVPDIRWQSADQFIHWARGAAACPFIDHAVWEYCQFKVRDELAHVVNLMQQRLGYD